MERIETISEKTHHSYGSRCLTRQLQDEGYAVGRFKVRRLMKQAGIVVQGRRRRPRAGLIHRSDRGSQCASHAYRGLLAEHDMVCSMSRKGDCLDNSVAERFFGSL